MQCLRHGPGQGLRQRHSLFVIEDNAEAFGGVYKGKKTVPWVISPHAVSAKARPSPLAAKGQVTTDNEDLAWIARSFRDHGYDVKDRLNLLELEQKLSYIHNMVGWNTHDGNAVGDWSGELDRMGFLEHAARRAQRAPSSWTR